MVYCLSSVTDYASGNVGYISCIFRLSELLEAPHITKVMHASSVDCMSAYKDGVNIWGLYDTAVAHRVLQLQTSGRLGSLLLCPVFLLPLVSFSGSGVDPHWFQYGSESSFLNQCGQSLLLLKVEFYMKYTYFL
jgi:hypothetical protein